MFSRARVTVLPIAGIVALFWTLQATPQTDLEREVLDANSAFYQDFKSGDPQWMDELWSNRSPVAVIHPSWPGISGREAVMQSWRQLMQAPPDLRITEARAHVTGDSAFVICYETLDRNTTLIATNIFSREDNVWKLVHHHAGTTTYIPSSGTSI